MVIFLTLKIFFIVIGVFLCLNASAFKNNANMFQTMSNEKARNASKKYWSQVSKFFRRNAEIVHKYVCPNYDVVYGIRKVSVSYATTYTTCSPPPILSVAHCGHFSEPSDTYLGCILAGYDPNSNTFWFFTSVFYY